MALQTSTKLTYDDYALIPDDGLRHEIIDGEHYVNPAPSLIHQGIVLNIATALRYHVRPRRLGAVFVAALDVVLSAHDIVQPDVLFIRAERQSILTQANVQGAPDLAVEVLSPSNRRYDEVIKRKRYDAFGVAEYWIADPERETVKIYRRTEAGLVLAESEDPVTTPLLPGFAISLADVFELDF
jgi:Uma2 family endonuclease